MRGWGVKLIVFTFKNIVIPFYYVPFLFGKVFLLFVCFLVENKQSTSKKEKKNVYMCKLHLDFSFSFFHFQIHMIKDQLTEDHYSC